MIHLKIQLKARLKVRLQVRLKALVISLLALAHSAHAEPLVLIGQVQRVTLVPPGVDDCPPRCQPPANIPEGTTWVCISGFGGCETLDVKVQEVISGTVDGPVHTLKNSIGEWGPRFPYTDKPVLISQRDGVFSWSTATFKDGKTFIDPKRIDWIGKVRTNAIPANAAGLVAIEDLREYARSPAAHITQ